MIPGQLRSGRRTELASRPAGRVMQTGSHLQGWGEDSLTHEGTGDKRQNEGRAKTVWPKGAPQKASKWTRPEERSEPVTCDLHGSHPPPSGGGTQG